ncbi:MAG TPA: hypothetical protein VN249_08990, partial [Prolixibacteraceae bacterium]|nr:hypothetical protein [Prolixibacteraceae bacterium]
MIEYDRILGAEHLEIALKTILRRLVTACFLLMFFNTAWSQDSVAVKKERNWSFNGYAKDMQTFIFPNAYQDFITYNLLHNRNNFKWNMSDRFTFALEERNRLYSGELSSMGPNYGDFIAYDNGLMNLSWNISSGNS